MTINKQFLVSLLCMGAFPMEAQLLNTTMDEAKDIIQNKVLNDASRIGRTSGAKAPEFQELYDYEAENETLADAVFPYQSLLHRAYVIMLAEEKILTLEEAGTLLSGLRKVDALADNDASLRLYLPYESALIKEIGSVGGKMHIGRSRNDLDNTTNRMFMRDKLLEIMESIVAFREVLLAKASDHKKTVMVAYTHRKQAQPITLGHYLTAIDESLQKSLDRYVSLYDRLDECPLGAGASGGTSWPINRLRVSQLLGFGKVVNNTIEGVAGWDHITEFASANAIYMSTLSRYASEVQLWSTDEYRSVELDNAFAGISSMMPQKKNPDALERTRKAAANTTGQLMAILTSVNAIEYQHSGTRSPLEPKSLESVLAATHAMTGLTRTMHINEKQMLRYAKENFSTMTDLSDLLVREAGFDFRKSHELIALVVNRALEEGLTADKITVAMIRETCRKHYKHDLDITKEQLQNAIDPTESIKRKTGIGMPSPVAVKVMIENGDKDITGRREWLEIKRKHLAAATAMILAKSLQYK